MSRQERGLNLSTTGLFLSVAYTHQLVLTADELRQLGQPYQIEVLGNERGDGEVISAENIWAVRVTGDNVEGLLQRVSDHIGGICLIRMTREEYRRLHPDDVPEIGFHSQLVDSHI